MDNYPLLSELAERRRWIHVIKARGMWARRLEGVDGLWRCRGPKGDEWDVQGDRLAEQYRRTARTDGAWEFWTVRSDVDGFWAARVPRDFSVQTPFGVQTGKAGDYLLRYRHGGDGDDAFPSDVWVVRAADFTLLYRRAVDPQQVAAAVAFLRTQGINVM